MSNTFTAFKLFNTVTYILPVCNTVRLDYLHFAGVLIPLQLSDYLIKLGKIIISVIIHKPDMCDRIILIQIYVS